MSLISLIADIGGTNVRLALSQSDGQFTDIKTYKTAGYSSLAEVIKSYFDENELSDKTINACLAIACPVDKDIIEMTNLPWVFSQSALKADLKLNQLTLINDYTAIAHAIPFLGDHQKVKIGQGEADLTKPIAICGPGTGLGVASLIPLNNQWHSVPGEGGHADFAPINEQEIAILKSLMKEYEHVSYEQLLSGKGIEQIYTALAQAFEAPITTLPAKEITSNAVDGTCAICQKSLAQFCQTLGSYAGNLALTVGSLGGVYIAGGIAPRFVEFIQKSEFRDRFESKGRLSGFNQKIPTYIITESQPGLLGASAYIQQINKIEMA